MALPVAFALVDAEGRKIKSLGCRVVKLKGTAEGGEIRFGPNTGNKDWTPAVGLAALDDDGDILGTAAFKEAVTLPSKNHVVVSFTLRGLFAARVARVEIDECYVRRGAPAGDPNVMGKPYVLEQHDNLGPQDGATNKVGG